MLNTVLGTHTCCPIWEIIGQLLELDLGLQFNLLFALCDQL